MKEQFSFLSPTSFEYQFNLLYTVYSFPNIIIPFLGGVLISLFGNRIMYIVFGACIVIGQFITSIGCSRFSMTSMLIGRIIFGIGGESLNVCQNTIIVKWFFKSSSALPLGLTITISRIGSVLNDVISPRVVKDNNASFAFWLGLTLAIFSFIMILILVAIDYGKDQALNENNNIIVNNTLINENICEIFKDIKYFNRLFWVITFLCLTSYGAVLPFNYISTSFFTSTSLKNLPKQQARKQAGIYMSIPFFMGAVLIPIFGLIIDNFGKRTFFALLSGIMCMLSFVLFYVMEPIIPLIILGLSYSIFASMIWAAVSISVRNKEKVGLAYGITTSIQNCGLAIFPIIVASIYANSGGYMYCLMFFASLGFISLGFGLWIIFENNYHYEGLLDKTKFEDENETRTIEIQSSSNSNDITKVTEEKNDDEIPLTNESYQ